MVSQDFPYVHSWDSHDRRRFCGYGGQRTRSQPTADQYGTPVPHSLKRQVNHLRHKIAAWLPHGVTPVTHALTIGFYVPWDDASSSSLKDHIGDLDWVIPASYTVNGPGHTFSETPDARFDAIMASAGKRPKLLPMVQNTLDDNWDGTGSAALFRDPAARKALLDNLEQKLSARHADGVVFDFENLPAALLADYRVFLGEARQRFSRNGWQVAVTMPFADDDWDLKAFAAVTDKLILMAYDQHSSVDPAGPIAGQLWFGFVTVLCRSPISLCDLGFERERADAAQI